MKKVFSVEKFEKALLSRNTPETPEEIELAKELWANKCDGKTEEEMLEMGYYTHNNWMIEVED